MRIAALLALALLLSSLGSAQQEKHQVVVVSGPTIIAFVHPITQADLDNGEGDAEAVNDFEYYLEKVRIRFEHAGVKSQVVFGSAFSLRLAKRTTVFNIGKDQIGYYFIAPGKKPHILYGVMTDEDLIDEARKYFHLAIK